MNKWDKAIGISFRCKNLLSTNVILNVWQKVTQSNSHVNALDKLILEEHSRKMPLGFGRGIKTKGRHLDVHARLKKIMVNVKA